MKAIITNRRPGKMAMHRNHPMRWSAREADRDKEAACPDICDVTCPICKHKSVVTFRGWTAIICVGCKEELKR